MEGKVLEPETTRRDDWIPLLSPPPPQPPTPAWTSPDDDAHVGEGREEAVEETEELY